MNKKILVVGDSYCASKNHESWCNKLAKKLNADISVIGEVSASLFYAYNALTTAKNHFDYVLVLVTNPGRLYYPDLPFFSNPFAAKWAKHTSDVNLQNKAQASEYYYNYLSNETFDNFVHDMIIEKIQKFLIGKNYIIYPNFQTSRIQVNYFTMLDITNQCFSRFFDTTTKFNYYKDIYQIYSETENVLNHTTLESQEIIAEHFFQLFNTQKSNIKIQDFDNCCPHNFDYYFSPRVFNT